jgi:hypothetical protein
MLRNLMQAVLFGNIGDEKLLMEIVRRCSTMSHYVPVKYIITFKQFRLHVTHRFPEWNYTFYDNRCYHALHDNYIHRTMDEMKNS